MSKARTPSSKSTGRGATRLPDAPPKARRSKKAEGPDVRSHLRAWLESHRASLFDSVRRLLRQPIGSFFTCLVMAIALCLPMGLALLLDSVERLSGTWQHAAQISVYLKMDVSDDEGLALRDDIATMPNVAEAEWISREQALEEFQALSGLARAIEDLPVNPLPGSVVVTPATVDKTQLESLRLGLADLPGVELAQLDLLWVERLGAILELGNPFCVRSDTAVGDDTFIGDR
jgi:cell division transport system permease protein